MLSSFHTYVLDWLIVIAAVFQAFAIFCGMGISNTHVYEEAVKAVARQSIALDILAYHTSASVEEVQRLKVSIVSLTPCLS